MAKPKLALIPAAQGTKLYSVLPSDGTGDFDFTRGSVATRINAQGLIENVASGQSRLNYPLIDGVQKGCPHHILEPARTNVVKYSESFSNAYWQKDEITVLANQTISPDGSLNADAIIESTTSNAYHRVLPTTPISGTGGTNYSCSVYVKKKGDTRHIYWFIQKGADAFYVHIDMTNYVVSDSNSSGSGNLVDASITPVGNDWYRISVSGVVSSTSGDYYNQIYLNKQLGSGFNPTQYTGDGISGLYLWGWQLEVGSFISSYIPTTSTAVTRSAETASGAGNSTTFNDSEGVLMAEISDLDSGGGGVISINTGNNTQKIFLYLLNNTTVRYYAQGSGGFISGDIPISSASNFNKISFKYKSSDFAIWINGFELSTNTSAITFSNLSSLDFYNPYLGGTENFYGKAKQIQYFDSALADTQLEQLTSWQSFRDMANGQLYTIE